MKRLIAILFLCVFLFNLFGYRILIHCLQLQEDAKLQTKTELLTNRDLVSIKVATQLPPYANVSNEYETVTGEVELEGMTYKYVKRKIFKDSIEFLCVAHVEKKRLENAREEFFKLSNDLQNASDHKKSNSTLQLKPVAFEYCSLTEHFILSTEQDNQTKTYNIFTPEKALQFCGSVDHPPERTLV